MQRALSRAEVAEVDARAAREMGVEARRIEEEAKRNANDAGARADAFKARVDALEDGLRKAGDEIHKVKKGVGINGRRRTRG